MPNRKNLTRQINPDTLTICRVSFNMTCQRFSRRQEDGATRFKCCGHLLVRELLYLFDTLGAGQPFEAKGIGRMPFSKVTFKST